MPAVPGETPRKMLPPPITTPISTPRRETCAISVTIPSMVCLLTPKGSSPIRASPDSLRRILLYLGVTARSVRLPRRGHHLGREVGGLLLDALADDEECVRIHLRLLRPEHLLD